MARREQRGRPEKLTDELEKQICAYIRAGAFAWVAAVASGISNTTFHRWMADERPRFRQFRDNVDRSRAEARLSAEVEVRRGNPEAWLRLGPGREHPDEPGWTESKKLEVSTKTGGLVIMLPPENPDG